MSVVNNTRAKSLTDIDNINIKEKHEHDATSLEKINRLKLNLDSKEYKKAVELNLDWYGTRGVDRVLKKYDVDVLLTVYGRPCNKIGYPILTMPFPLDRDGLPIKKPAFCTSKLGEKHLFEVGFALENWIDRPVPGFKQIGSKEDFQKFNRNAPKKRTRSSESQPSYK